MNNLNILTTDRLRKLIRETEETLVELKTELERREELNQNQEIEHLERHMKSAELSLTTIRNFLNFLMDDMRSTKE
jgi:hypothetical protein